MSNWDHPFALKFVEWAQKIAGDEAKFIRGGQLNQTAFCRSVGWDAGPGRQRFKENKQLQEARAAWESVHVNLDQKQKSKLPDLVPSKELEEAKKFIGVLQERLTKAEAEIKRLSETDTQNARVRELIARGGRYTFK